MEERRTRANGRATRELIVSAAADLFAHKGYRGTTLKDVAATAGVTLPGLLHHFADKDALLGAVVEQRELATATPLASLDDLPYRERLSAAVDALVAVNAAHPVHQLLLQTLVTEAVSPDHPLHELFVARYRRVRSNFAASIRAAQATGQWRADADPVTDAIEAIAMLDGVHLQWLLDPDDVDLAAALGAWVKRFAES